MAAWCVLTTPGCGAARYRHADTATVEIDVALGGRAAARCPVS
jgi:hypothetical protein